MSNEVTPSSTPSHRLLIISVVCLMIVSVLFIVLMYTLKKDTDTVTFTNEPAVLDQPEYLSGRIASMNADQRTLTLEAQLPDTANTQMTTQKTFIVNITDQSKITKRNIAIPDRDTATSEAEVSELATGQNVVLTTQNNPRVPGTLDALTLQFYYEK